MVDLTDKVQAAMYMRKATSADDWNDRCDAVKLANGGRPRWWHAMMVTSGLYGEVRERGGW